MRSATPAGSKYHCTACMLRLEACVCKVLPRVHNRIEVVIIRHVLECHLTSNTGRLLALALENCRLLDYGGGTPFDDSSVPQQDALLLFPGRERQLPQAPVQRLVVLDATFHQARRMYRRIPRLRALPELSLAPQSNTLRLRQPTHCAGMSTIEAVAEGLRLLEGESVSAPLHELFAEFVRRSDRVRGRRR